MTRRMTWLAVVVALAVAAAPLRAEIIEQILVKVNGEIVTRSTFERMQMDALRAVDPGDPALQVPDLLQALLPSLRRAAPWQDVLQQPVRGLFLLRG